MKKIKVLSLIILTIILLGGNCFAAQDNMQKIEKQKTIPIEITSDYRNSINKEITKDNKKYVLENVEEKENTKTLTLDKEITEEIIVNTNDEYKVLNSFESKKEIEVDGYRGNVELQNNSLKIKVNESYQEEYKVYLQKVYTDVKSNELNDIPKEIRQDGTTYYLVNPVWNICKTEKVGQNDVPVSYNGTMYYEGVKIKTIIKNYKATATYKGTLEKKVIDSITFYTSYKEVKEETNNIIPLVATSSVVIFSGIILLKMKNARVYNYEQDKCRFVKRLHISKKDRIIDITPLRVTSNKYKIVLSNSIYKELKNSNVTIKYFDMQFMYCIKDKKFEINV